MHPLAQKILIKTKAVALATPAASQEQLDAVPLNAVSPPPLISPASPASLPGIAEYSDNLASAFLRNVCG